jgi:hypothetical protein
MTMTESQVEQPPRSPISDEELIYRTVSQYIANDDDDEAMDFLEGWADKNKYAKYRLAKFYLDSWRREDYPIGLGLLQELADIGYLHAIIDLTIQLYRIGDTDDIRKYVLRPFTYPTNTFSQRNASWMIHIAEIAKTLYQPDELLKFYKNFPENKFACAEEKKLSLKLQGF